MIEKAICFTPTCVYVLLSVVKQNIGKMSVMYMYVYTSEQSCATHQRGVCICLTTSFDFTKKIGI